MFYTPKNDFTNFATMKKIALFVFLLLIAVISFGQTVPIQAKTLRVNWGSDNYSINLNGDSVLIDASDFIWFAKKFGSDTLLFGDGTYMTSADTYVKITGDTMAGIYLLSSGKLNMSTGTGSETSINWGNTSDYSTFGHKLDQYSLTIRSGWAGTSPLGTYIANDTIILTGGYIGGDVDTITSSSMSAPYYTFNIPGIVLNGEINGLAYESNDISRADDESILITNGAYGWGEVYAFNAGTIDEWAEFIISTDGTVYLKSNSTDVVNTDTDNKLCIFDNGSGVTIRNRLGGARTIKYIIHH